MHAAHLFLRARPCVVTPIKALTHIVAKVDSSAEAKEIEDELSKNRDVFWNYSPEVY